MPPEPPAQGARRSVRIGKYDVVSHIASGGMGAVYKAIDTDLGRDVALKVLPSDLAANPAMLERFRREARHAAKLRHENIVTVYECGEASGTHYLALEFIDGVDLHEYVTRKGRLGPDEACEVLRQALLALNHAHQRGIVHRDIKPSNFLLTRKDGELLVKLTDLGLARHQREDECRVTRAGSTVGTVDYMPPEQARNSAAADVRSDIYSLGCTFYHVLAGRPPFPEGSMTERLYKHIEEEPPDVRELNPQVSDGLGKVLRRMMAKKPADRYQTPAEVLQALGRVADFKVPVLVTEEGDDPAGGAVTAARKAPSTGAARAPRSKGRRSRASQDTVSRDDRKTQTVRAPGGSHALLVLGVGAALLAAAAVAFVLLIRSANRPAGEAVPADDPATTPARPQPTQRQPPPTGQKPPDPEPGPKKPELLTLSGAVALIDPAKLRAEWEAPWAADPPPDPAAPVLRVSRAFPEETDARFRSLAAALAALKDKGGTAVVELHDNGPLFEPALAVAGHDLVVRAAKGYRPLLVWDLAKGKDKSAFLSAARGSLTLEDVDVVLRCPDGAAEPVAFCRVADGDFRARGCTFSLAGKPRDGVAVARLEGEKSGCKGRLSGCHARGVHLVALDLLAPAAEALVEHSLVAGGEQPLVRVLGRDAALVTVRVARSTLVAGQAFLRLTPAGPGDKRPALRWLGWDSLLARSHNQPGGELVAVAGGADAGALQWRAANCLYAGWRTLLQAQPPVSADDWQAWRRRVQISEGDKAVEDRWPPAVRFDPAEQPAADYRVAAGSPVGYAATPEPNVPPRPLGCDPSALPPTRDTWLSYASERHAVPALEVLTGSSAPAIPAADDGLYHGEVLEKGKVEDPGAYLEGVKKAKKLAPKVVLRLSGSGDWPTSPVLVQGSSLVLSFEPPEPTGDKPPLVLTPQARGAGGHDALIAVEGGDLDVVGGEIRFPSGQTAAPAHLLKVKEGTLRVHGARLFGPLTNVPESFRGVVHLDGSGAKPVGCTLHEAVLASGKVGVHVTGNDVRLRARHCAVVAGEDGFHFEPGPAARPKLGVQVLLENVTAGVKGSVVRLDDAPHLTPPAEPILLRAQACVFQGPPFREGQPRPGRAAFLTYGGDALARGLLAWQGEGNVYDRRLLSYVLPAGAERSDKGRQYYAAWAQTWGAAHDVRPVTDVPFANTLDLANLQVEALRLPPNAGSARRPWPGADFARLPLGKKRTGG